MKTRIPLLILNLFFLALGHAQVSKTIHVTNPGTLSTLLTPTELNAVTDLTLTGDIDARDFKTMKDKMPRLANLDMTNVSIQYYVGGDGPEGFSNSESGHIVEYPANEIPSHAFYYYYSWPHEGKASLRSIKMPSNITSIGVNAFLLCKNLTGQLTLPETLKSVKESAFSWCNFTGNLVIPTSVKSIGLWAFAGCRGFTGSLIIPSNVTSIGEMAFAYCSGFNGELNISDSLTEIEDGTFYSCTGLKGSIIIPNRVKSIGSAFNNCTGFDGNLILGDSVVEIRGSFYGCCGLTGHLIIPPSVNNIGSFSFKGCKGFSGSLNIPETVTWLGSSAFQGCSGFNGTLSLPPLITSIENSIFDSCSGLTGNLNIPPKVTYVDEYAFRGCKGFEGELKIPTSVRWIQSYAFFGCSGFTGSLTIPSSLGAIYDYTFAGCSGFNGSLNLPPTIYSIGTGAFSGCSGFTGSLKIPEFTVEYGALIGDNAFEGCKGFNDTLILPTTTPYKIGNYAFSGCSGFSGSLIIPTAAKSIGTSAFSGCSGFNGSLSISPAIVSIGENAFKDCSGLNETLIIPASVTTIGSGAFINCFNIKKINAYGNDPNRITLGSNIFLGIPKTTCNLFVPVTKKILYESATQWKDFVNINEGVPATVLTGNINSIYTVSPTGKVNITNIDPNNPTKYGVVWSTVPNPKVENSSKCEYGPTTTLGLFIYTLPELSPNTKYYLKAFASNSIETTYGEELTFTTPAPVLSPPSVNSLSGFKTANGTASETQSFIISGKNLVSNLVVTAPTGFEIRLEGFSSYYQSISILSKQGVVPETTIIVRIASKTPLSGTVSSNIVCSSSWATDQYVALSGEITQKQLTITNPTIITNKMVDGNTTAVVSKLGNLQGLDNSDIGDVSVTANATYDDANVGSNKTITVVYTLTGNAKDKYLAPENYIITNAKISDYITLNHLTSPNNGCEGSSLDLPYIVRTGTPTQYSVTFNSNALNAGMKNINYQALINNDSNGSLYIPIPANTLDGNYEGILKMKNELNVESEGYPFEFTVDVSSNKIVTKFNELIIFDNADSRFVGYQWLIYGIEIPGATKQYYYSPSGFIGDYSLRLTTNDGKTLYTCPKEFNIFSSLLNQVKISPNPTKQNEDFMVSLTGINDNELKNSGLSVYNAQGVCVYKTNIVVYENMLSLNEAGLYIVRIDMPNKRFVSKVVVSQ